jgi:hypothetical protein
MKTGLSHIMSSGQNALSSLPESSPHGSPRASLLCILMNLNIGAQHSSGEFARTSAAGIKQILVMSLKASQFS